MSIAFYLLAALTLGGALAAVLLKNTVHCALALTARSPSWWFLPSC
jgi:NADH:ubiquinone oxidoreductase subunit 6 (subunit J)